MELNLELEKAVSAIKKHRAKNVCIQLPDGLKPKGSEIIHFLEENTQANICIWMGTCYGACDKPTVPGMDLIICFGHSVWKV